VLEVVQVLEVLEVRGSALSTSLVSLTLRDKTSRLGAVSPPRSARVADLPKDLLYTEEHEYVKATEDSGIVQIGITDYAQGELGDVVYVELPTVGTSLDRMDVFGTIEAVKAVSELFSPLSGEVVAVNTRLDKEPALVNTDPYGDGWMVRLRLKNEGERKQLMNAEAYGKHIGQ
jgi:glycine cleavage system H protein